MKRAFLIAIGMLALAGLLVADTAWPSLAEEIPAASPVAAATADSSLPSEAAAQTSDNASPGVDAEETSAQDAQSSAQAAPERPDEPTAGASRMEIPAD